jgi:apolipoprotein N-acyltransferase
MVNKIKINFNKTTKLMVAFFTGAISVLGWAPFLWPAVNILAYGILIVMILRNNSLLHIILISTAFSLGIHGFGHLWIFTSLLNNTQAGFVISLIGSIVFISYLSLFTIIPCLIFCVLLNFTYINNFKTLRYWSAITNVLTIAACFTLGEYSRSIFFNGFTGLSLGYTFVDSWANGWIPVVGIYGASFLAFCIAAVPAVLYYERANILERYSIGFLGIACAMFWVKPVGHSLSYRLIQANVQQSDKFNPVKLPQQISAYLDLITSGGADLVITPETAFPVFLNQLPSGSLDRLIWFSNSTKSHLFLGIPFSSTESDGYNSLLHISPVSSQFERYDKIRLMPFGEYSPIGFGWFTNQLSIPLKDLSSGPANPRPFTVSRNAINSDAVQIGTLICHEDLVGSNLLHWLPQSNILINPSNLAWFDGSIGLDQRIQIVQARALEAGRPILRATNTGITAHIDHQGKIVSKLPKGKETFLSGSVSPVTGQTPYSQFGDWPVLILCLVIIGSWVQILRTNGQALPRS